MERQGNPWGLGQDKRDEWEGDLPLPKWGDGGEYEYLFYVGCAGSYDERMKKVSRAVAKVLTQAKVKFATLGKEETCNGELARRGGNEYLYQTIAKANVEAWNGKGIKAIVTQCPHCYNTIEERVPGVRRQLPGAVAHRAHHRAHQGEADQPRQGDERRG